MLSKNTFSGDEWGVSTSDKLLNYEERKKWLMKFKEDGSQKVFNEQGTSSMKFPSDSMKTPHTNC